jgi:hypothetical protein
LERWRTQETRAHWSFFWMASLRGESYAVLAHAEIVLTAAQAAELYE